ncbi:MAG: metallophosphoesterase [Solirubrobacteraceae bacterium]
MAPNAPLKLLHLADVHLDRPFVGLAASAARARRRELREALEPCLALAVAHRVDVVTIGGDLWEDEHVTPDTCRWVADRLGDVGVPVVLVAGNHDPLRPGGPYRRVEWPANVHVLPAESPTHPGLQRQELGPLSVWGETGRHTVAVVELAPGAPPRVELHDVNRRRYAETVVDCEGATSSAEVERALRGALAEAAADGGREGLCLRAVLRGRVAPECRIAVGELAAAGAGLTLLDLRDATQPAFDLELLATQPTAIGLFVRDLRERIARCDADAQRRRLELALDLGLRAMHGEDLARAA